MNEAGRGRRWRTAAWVLLVVLYALALQHVRPLYSPDEGRYTNVALNMLDSGDWMHPRLHHEVEHWSKPPFTYWAIAASVGLFGRNEFAARLPGALAFAATILLMLRLGRRFVPAQPWLPALVYASFLFPPLAANLVTTDTLLTFWETATVVGFVEWWWARDERDSARARLLLGVAAGFAFLTKGPPALLALAGCLAFAAFDTDRRRLRGLLHPRVWLPFLLIGGSWYLAVGAQEPQVMRYFLVEEVVNRVASDKMRRNAEWYGAFKVYLPTLLLGSLPWLPVLLRAAWRHRRDARRRLAESPLARLLLCWLLLPLLVFMLARSRLPLYVLPLFAPLALLAARALAPLALRGWRLGLIGTWLVLIVLCRALPALVDVPDDDRRLADGLVGALGWTPDEIAFVEAPPRFGLRFYLGSQIERLDLSDTPNRPQSQSLRDELTESEGCRVLLADPAQAALLEQSLGALDAAYHRLADLRGYAAYVLRSADCPASQTIGLAPAPDAAG